MASMQMKMAMATQKSGNLEEPLLDKNGDSPDSEDSKSKCCGPLKIIYFIGAAGLSAIWGLGATSGSALVYVAAPVGIFFAFYAAGLASALSASSSVNQMQNEMRSHVNQLGEENDKLSAQNERLEGEVEKVGEIDAKLKGIAEAQGTNVNRLVELVSKNSEYLRRMHAITKAETAQKLVELVIESDTDGDFMIDENECELLIIRMNNFRSYIKVNAKNFKAALKAGGGSLKGVMNIVKTIVADDDEVKKIPESERIFIIDENLGQRDKGKKKH